MGATEHAEAAGYCDCNIHPLLPFEPPNDNNDNEVKRISMY